MRKGALLSLLSKYDSAKSWWSIIFNSDPAAIVLLKEFLEIKSIADLTPSDDVSWDSFKEFIFDKNGNFDAINEILPNEEDPAAKILKEFRQSSYQVIQDAPILKLPNDILNKEIAPFLDPDDISSFFRTEKSLHSKINLKDICIICINKILALGVNADLLNTVVKAGAIKNYKNLYRAIAISKPLKNYQFLTQPWQLLCLSGEPKAFDVAIEKFGLLKDTTDEYGRNAMHYAALSGVPAQLNKAIISLKLDPKQTDKHGRNVMHFAALSGEPEQIDAANKLKLDPKQTNSSGLNTMHYAAWSGEPAQFDKAISLGLKPEQTDTSGCNAMHYAALSGVPAQLDKAIALGLDPKQTDEHGRNAMHFAAWSGVPAQLDKAISLGLDPKQTNIINLNAMHYAALSGVPEQINKAISLGLDPKQTDDQGYDALYYAKISKNPEAVAAVEKALSQQENAQVEKVQEIPHFRPLQP